MALGSPFKFANDTSSFLLIGCLGMDEAGGDVALLVFWWIVSKFPVVSTSGGAFIPTNVSRLVRKLEVFA